MFKINIISAFIRFYFERPIYYIHKDNINLDNIKKVFIFNVYNNKKKWKQKNFGKKFRHFQKAKHGTPKIK